MKISKQVQTYNEMASEYAKKSAKGGPLQELDRFLKMLSPISLILDAGCAAGRDTKRISDKGYKVIGLDFSEELLKIGKDNNPNLEFVWGSVTEIPFPANKFDGIWAIGLLHELDYDDMNTALKEFYRVLKDKGVIFIRTKEGIGDATAQKDVYSDKERVTNLLQMNDLKERVSSTGFEIIDSFVQQSPSRNDVKWLCIFARK